MRVFTVVLLLAAVCYASPVSTLYQGLDLATVLLDLVKNKFYILRTAVDNLKQGIANLRNSPINDYEIANLEPGIMQMISKLSAVANNPSILDRLDFGDSATLIGGLASLRRILPSNQAEFNMKFRSQGANSMISQAMVQINNIVYTLGF